MHMFSCNTITVQQMDLPLHRGITNYASETIESVGNSYIAPVVVRMGEKACMDSRVRGNDGVLQLSVHPHIGIRSDCL